MFFLQTRPFGFGPSMINDAQGQNKTIIYFAAVSKHGCTKQATDYDAGKGCGLTFFWRKDGCSGHLLFKQGGGALVVVKV